MEEAVPIIHGTVEHRGVKPAPVCLRGKPARVRRFRCLLFRLPQIRFVSGATRCSDYQAGKKREKKKGGGGYIGAGPRLINSERKSCSLGDTSRSRHFLDRSLVDFCRSGFRFMDRDSNYLRWQVVGTTKMNTCTNFSFF